MPRPRFTVATAGATAYRSDAFQPLYFVSDSPESVASVFSGFGRLPE